MVREISRLMKINLLGDYTKQDLELVKIFYERTYGFNIREHSNTYSIYIIHPEMSLKYMGATEHKCASQKFKGLSIDGRDIILTSSSNYTDPIYFFSTLAHEYAHQMHAYLSGKYPEFNKEWDSIQGGYARRYGTNNRNEDVATVVQAAVVAFLEGKDVMTIKPWDGNVEAFHAKLRLLKEYKFLPPGLVVR